MENTIVTPDELNIKLSSKLDLYNIMKYPCKSQSWPLKFLLVFNMLLVYVLPTFSSIFSFIIQKMSYEFSEEDYERKEGSKIVIYANI